MALNAYTRFFLMNSNVYYMVTHIYIVPGYWTSKVYTISSIYKSQVRFVHAAIRAIICK